MFINFFHITEIYYFFVQQYNTKIIPSRRLKIRKQNPKLVTEPTNKSYKEDHEIIIKIKHMYYKSIINLSEVEKTKKKRKQIMLILETKI